MIPDGTLIKGSMPPVYVMEEGKKRPIASSAAFHFYQFKGERILVLDDYLLSQIPEGRVVSDDPPFRLHCPSWLLVKPGKNNGIYLLYKDVLHPIVSQSAFLSLKFEFSEVVTIPEVSFVFMKQGHAIDESTFENHGVIDRRIYRGIDGNIYYAENGRLRHVSIAAMYSLRWKPEQAIPLPRKAWNQAVMGTPILPVITSNTRKFGLM